MDHLQNFAGKVPAAASQMVPLIQQTFPFTYIFSFLGMGTDEVRRALVAVNHKISAAHSASIDNIILTLACCMVISAFAHRIAAAANWLLFSRLPVLFLLSAVALSSLWSLFLGTLWYQLALSGSLVVGGGKFGPQYLAVHSLLAMGMVQAVIWVAPPQGLSSSWCGMPIGATPSSEPSTYSKSEEFYEKKSTETVILSTSHANGHWIVPTPNTNTSSPYLHLVSYFDDSAIVGPVDMDSVWLFGPHTTLKDVAIANMALSGERQERGNVKLCTAHRGSTLEPILILSPSARVFNVSVECSAFSNNGPCVIVSSSTRRAGLPNGVTILVNGKSVTREEAEAAGLVRATSDPLSDAVFQCAVDRHEPAWHRLVRRWPLTSLVLKQVFDVTSSVVSTLMDTVGWPLIWIVWALVSELWSAVVASFCGSMSGAGVLPMPLCPDQGSVAYSAQSLAEVIMGPSLSYDAFRLAALQQVYTSAEATTSMVMWTGLPLLAKSALWAAEFDWTCTVFMYEWTIQPFISLGYAFLEGFVLSLASIFTSTNIAEGSSGLAGFIATYLHWVLSGLWSILETSIWPASQAVGLSALRTITRCLNLYADTGFNVQLFMALLQTLVVVYNLHLQCVASARVRWSWTSYPYAMARMAVRNYKSIVVYGATHLLAGLLVLSTAFMPFSGALGLHFLTLNVIFPVGSCYALLHFMGYDKHRKALGVTIAVRILLSIIIQKVVGDLVAKIISELIRLLMFAAVVVAGAIYFGWRVPPASPLTPQGGNNNGNGGDGGNNGGGGTPSSSFEPPKKLTENQPTKTEAGNSATTANNDNDAPAPTPAPITTAPNTTS